MRSFTSGPFGVLLMVAPLVAIPLLSTFGIPQLFSPVEASPVASDLADDSVVQLHRSDENGDSTAEPLQTPASRTPSPTVDSKRNRSRMRTLQATTVLFEPVDEADGDDAPRASGSGSIVSLTDDAGKKANRSSNAGKMAGFEVVGEDFGRGNSSDRRRGTAGGELEGRDKVMPLDAGPELLTKPEAEEELRRPGTPARKNAGVRSENQRTPAGESSEVDSATFTLQYAQKRLNELGIRNFKIESLQDFRFRFTCALTGPDNPQVTRRFVAEADEPAQAVQKALQQVEAWLAAR